MMYNNIRPEGERHMRGEGPVRIRAIGGGGRPPSYAEGAADYTVWLSMTSITRLRMMSYLCLHGPTRIPALAKKLEVPEISVRNAMWGLKATWAVEGKPCVIGRPYVSRSKTGGCYAMEWDATDTGRKWLWRYGWVTRRIGWDYWWQSAGYKGRLDVMPYDVLRDCAEPTLLRPVALAIARYLTFGDPATGPRIAQLLGFNRSVVEQYMNRWLRLGWLDRRDPERPEGGWVPEYGAPAWKLNPWGEAAFERHADALRWASQTCGYIPPKDDAFFNDEDMVHYLTVEYVNTSTGDRR